ncbi:hypothetical protein SDC9_11359 [bioreactor metagenome]|uniref:GerMN domain-containing protein n=1 Tax=bioreactor metagenome TaxID=1076179 RepID=A0A644TFF0_9ZZZZ|nr:GerMN domain-containing protein [Negativicutes bacterium]
MRSTTRYLLCLILALAMLVSGCASSLPASDMQSGNSVKSTQKAPQTAQNGNEVKADIVKITVYRATLDAVYLVPEIHQITRNESPAKTALELLLSPPNSKNVVSPIPKDTVLKKLTIKDRIAYADFNDKIIKNNIGGSASERLLVGAIVNTLTEFPEIEKVQILVEGKVIETISGHVDISEPLSRSIEIIKK